MGYVWENVLVVEWVGKCIMDVKCGKNYIIGKKCGKIFCEEYGKWGNLLKVWENLWLLESVGKCLIGEKCGKFDW